jgi:hypothetical protein
VSNNAITTYAFHILKEIENGQFLKGRGLAAKVVISLVMALLKHKRKPDVNQMILYARTTKEEVSTCYKRLKREPMFQQVETRIMPVDIVISKS